MSSKGKLHQWAHARLVRYVECKAEALGIEAVYVAPETTSKRCCECGHTSDGNRTERDFVSCEKCCARRMRIITRRRTWITGCPSWDTRFTADGRQSTHPELGNCDAGSRRGFVSYSKMEPEAESTDKPHLALNERTRQGERSRVG